MEEKVELREASLTPRLQSVMHDYYQKLNAGDFCAGQWEKWMDQDRLEVYEARVEDDVAAWLIFNPEQSTVEDIFVEEAWETKGLEEKMLDELLREKSLIAAEVLTADREKFAWLIEYGFRPARSFSRGGFSLWKMELSTAVLFRRLAGWEDHRQYVPKEPVALEKIPGSRTDEEIKLGLRRLLDKLGGISRFVKPGQTVLIKPNIVSDHGLREGVYYGGIVTDVRLVKALVEQLLPVAGKIIIGEGSSINRSATEKMFGHYGYDQIVAMDPSKINLLDLNQDQQVEKEVLGGRRMASRNIPVSLAKADVIISMPVMKNHFAAVASLAIKNLQGAVPPLEKYMSHYYGLWQSLVNIHHIIQPDLIILDGLTGQENFGPLSGTPIDMNLLLAGTNPVAVDSTAMRIMGIAPETSPPVLLACMQGIGPIEQKDIDILGPPVEEVMKAFQQPVILTNGGRDIVVHDEGACIGCRAYLHFALSKLRKPDPLNPGRLLIDRPREPRAHIFLGPQSGQEIDGDETNVFMGLCQQHHARQGLHLPGCPPHSEVIIDGIYRLFPGLEKAKYADESEEAKLGKMLKEIQSREAARTE